MESQQGEERHTGKQNTASTEKEMGNSTSTSKQENASTIKNKPCKQKRDASKRRKSKVQESEEKRNEKGKRNHVQNLLWFMTIRAWIFLTSSVRD